ncbi:MAG: hypothetical protein SW833_08800 [Cyanobacteriota bacterium]|nr:hypothetical protein [Cyanobacteriota bacterium]
MPGKGFSWRYCSFNYAHLLTLPEAAPLGRSLYDSLHAEALSKITVAVAEAGQLERALELVRSLQVYSARSTALRVRADALREAGESDRALDIGVRIPDYDELQAEALGEIAVAVAKAGQIERALEVARTVPDLDWQFQHRIFSDMAVAIAEAGQLKSAFEVAREIDHDWDLAHTLSELYEIAVALTEAGRFGLVLETVGAFPDDEYGRNAASGIVFALAEAELFDRALEAARNPSNQAGIRSRMARHLVRNGETQSALENARRALELTLSLSDDLDKAVLLTSLAPVFAEAGERDREARIGRHRALDLLDQALVLVDYQSPSNARP